jgi:hypothetical protein
MRETKFVETSPSSVNRTIEIWSNFGWEVSGTPQEIFSQSSHLEKSAFGDEINSVITTTNYVKITFQRETTMKNYARIKELENEYDSTPMPRIEANAPEEFGLVRGIIIGVLILNFVWFFIPTIIGLVMIKKRMKVLKEQKIKFALAKAVYEQKRAEVRTRLRSIELKAKALLA